MAKKFQTEKDGQIKFFQDLRIDTEVELSNNTDGVYKGTLFEFKLIISDINKVLFQAIKYLSHLRIKGENIPKNILLVSLNTETAYLFDSENFTTEIEKIYIGSASRNNEKFDTKIKSEIVKYNNHRGLKRVFDIFDTEKFTKIHIDVFCVVGWAERFYRENPKATKIEMFDELRNPKHFSDFIYAWEGKEQDFKYIMDCLNDRMHKKELGAFYTPPAYCKKATELVRMAISQIPKENDYIILDRCAGTGNLEEFLTDKKVDEITISELDKYLERDFIKKYLKDKQSVIDLLDYNDFNNITLGELERRKTKINIHDYLFDNELSHVIVNTYELKEWVVLENRIGNKVKMIIPPPIEVKNTESLVNGGDALSENFIFGVKTKAVYDLSDDYYNAISELNGYIKNPKINVILFENPPYSDSCADNTDKVGSSRKGGKNFVQQEMKTTRVTSRDLSNQFIWSAWKYYLPKQDDFYVVFSPIKYWKSLELCNKKFINGYLFNRQHFHASPSAISCILWKNEDENIEKITLKSLDIYDNEFNFEKDIEILKVHKPLSDLRKPFGNGNIIGYYYADSYSIRPAGIGLRTTPLPGGGNTELRSDNFIEKLPLFCAKLYPQKNWYERDIYFTTADGGDKYTKDSEFLKFCLIFTCLTPKNHCLSFVGTDNKFYKNELCFDNNTLANEKLKEFSPTETEKDLQSTFKEILDLAKITKKYNPMFTYGTYQIDQELNTRYKDETNTIIYDYPELNTKIIALKGKLAKYYEDTIQPKLFEYELLK